MTGVDDLVAAVDPELVDKPFPLLEKGPAVVEELAGFRPHRSALIRWASRGLAGVRLSCINTGRGRATTRRRLLQFWQEVDDAKRAKAARPKRRKRVSARS